MEAPQEDHQILANHVNSLKANGLFTVKSLARGNDVGQRYIIDFIHQRNT